MNLIKINGKNWSKISKIMTKRNCKQIRDRYLNSLDENIKKGKFTPEEDKQILELYKIHRNSWKTIASYFSSRTGDMIKNRFYSILRQKSTKNKNIENSSQINYGDSLDSNQNDLNINMIEEGSSQNPNFHSNSNEKQNGLLKSIDLNIENINFQINKKEKNLLISNNCQISIFQKGMKLEDWLKDSLNQYDPFNQNLNIDKVTINSHYKDYYTVDFYKELISHLLENSKYILANNYCNFQNSSVYKETILLLKFSNSLKFNKTYVQILSNIAYSISILLNEMYIKFN